jgi:hypothetical protein
MVDDVTFKVEDKRLDLHIDFPKGSRFACPVCGQECPVHDTRLLEPIGYIPPAEAEANYYWQLAEHAELSACT